MLCQDSKLYKVNIITIILNVLDFLFEGEYDRPRSKYSDRL